MSCCILEIGRCISQLFSNRFTLKGRTSQAFQIVCKYSELSGEASKGLETLGNIRTIYHRPVNYRLLINKFLFKRYTTSF